MTEQPSSRSLHSPASPSDRAATPFRRRTGYLVLAWIATFLVATLLHVYGAMGPGGAAYGLAALQAILGVLTLASYVGFLRDSDELERKIQVEALALGFGAGAVWMMAYRLFERADAPALDVNDPLLVMLGAFGVGVALARRRYA